MGFQYQHVLLEQKVISPHPQQARTLSHYLSRLQGTLKGVLVSSLIGPSSLSSSDSSFTHWWFGKNSLHFPLCGSRIRLGGRGGGGTCSGGGSRSSWESSFHCSWRKRQEEARQCPRLSALSGNLVPSQGAGALPLLLRPPDIHSKMES